MKVRYRYPDPDDKLYHGEYLVCSVCKRRGNECNCPIYCRSMIATPEPIRDDGDGFTMLVE